MAKKLKAVIDDDSLANAVRASAAQIWQAGLGAFAKAQEEGSRVFSKLVKDGAELQKDRRISGQQPGAADKLEQVFEERVARALATIGVPGQDEVDALRRQVGQLTEQVAALAAALDARPAAAARKAPAAAGTKPAPAAKAVAKKAARKTAARKTAAHKTAARKA